MKVTVCELKNQYNNLEQEWQNLVKHVSKSGSDLVLLPEMPFYPWIAKTRHPDLNIWQASVKAHDIWMSRLKESAPSVVLGTRPIDLDEKHLNEAFIWDKEDYTAVHHKHYLPEEEGWWESSWFERGEKDFTAVENFRGKMGFLICTELWFGVHAREYSKQGIELLACPRATGVDKAGKWIAGGQTAAVLSGAYCRSSNFSSSDGDEMKWGGGGWIVEPENGSVLGVTSREHPFLTMEIDLTQSKKAKNSYPRYVID